MTVSFDEVPFIDVIEELREVAKINLVISQEAKDYGDLDDDSLVTIQMKDTPAYQVIHFMLRSLESTYKIEDGTIVVIPFEERFELSNLRTKIYNCSKLFGAMKRSSPPFGFSGPRGGGFGGSGGGVSKGGGMFSIPSTPQNSDPICLAGIPSGPAPMTPANSKFGNATYRTQGAFGAQYQMPVDSNRDTRTPDEIHHAKCDALSEVFMSIGELNEGASIKFVGDSMLVSGDEASLRKLDSLFVDLHSNMGLSSLEEIQPSLPSAVTGEIESLGELQIEEKVKPIESNPFGDSSGKSDDPFGNSEKRQNGSSDNPFGR